MREEGIFLKHRVHGPAVRRQVCNVFAVEGYLALACCLKAREQSEQRGLAAA